MRNIYRGGFVAIIAAVSLTVMVVMAGAAAGISFNPSGLLLGDGSGVHIDGSVTCSYQTLGTITRNLSETASLTIQVAQKHNSANAYGSTTLSGISCDGAPHAFGADVPDQSTVLFDDGPATVTGDYQACSLSTGLCIEGQQGHASAVVQINEFPE